jgi:hypothetical protein
MTTPEQPVQRQASFDAGSLVVSPRPDEPLATLTRMEFHVLRDGELNEARAGRDLCLGFCGSAAIGFMGLIATIDWDSAFRLSHKAPFIWTTLLFAITFSSAWGALIYHQRYRRNRNSSAYSDLMKDLAGHFARQHPPER